MFDKAVQDGHYGFMSRNIKAIWPYFVAQKQIHTKIQLRELL
jgi:hypothetical protein